MILYVQPVSFWQNGRQTFVDADGRMGWDVGPNQQTHFRVIRNPPLPFAGIVKDGSEDWSTWRCDCAESIESHHVLNPQVCDHIQEAYLHWLHTENKKQTMMEQVKQHAEQAKITKLDEPQIGFVVKPKRIINLE